MTAVADVTAHDRTTPVAWLSRQYGRLSPTDRSALTIWLTTRLAVLALTWPAAFIFRGGAKSPQGWFQLWQNWDAVRLADIAQFGYFSPAEKLYPDQIAFFPGFPAALDIVHALARQWTVSGLIVSFLAGAVAVVALSRIAERDYLPGSGSKAVLFLVVSPAAIFLAAGYTEALFLALAATSWLCARSAVSGLPSGDRTAGVCQPRDRWVAAVLLAGLASVVRINGLFLCAAVAFEILRRADGQRVRALVTFLPALVPLACYEIYLKVSTGSWLAWMHAEQHGWQRQLTNPIDTFKTTWAAGFGSEFSAPINFVFQLEIFAVAAGVIVTIALLVHRRWPEAIYVGLTIFALATSIWYESVPRSLLLLWPLWCGLAVLAMRRAWIGYVYLAISIPISAAIGLLFMSGNWAG
ncbi:MAG TPA: mannosyltransferase family protein [Streptosporangiaceae bacterium]|nr:mannosyltransferase family protein [Streptosporangiaceae bacterium]